MKTIQKQIAGVIALTLFVSVFSRAGDPVQYYYIQHPTRADLERERIGAIKAQASADAEALTYQQKLFVPRDPWRSLVYHVNVPGQYPSSIVMQTNYAKGDTWVHFTGRIMEVRPDSILVQGWYGAPMDLKHGASNAVFEVHGFPRPYIIGVNQNLLPGGHFVAHLEASPARHSFGELEYGTIEKNPGTAAAPIAATQVKP